MRLGDYFENPASWSAALVEHAAVLEAIRATTPTQPAEAMQQHLKKATGRYSASWRRAKGPDASQSLQTADPTKETP